MATPNAFIVDYTSKEKFPKKSSWTRFEREFMSREDFFKYEWAEGIVTRRPNVLMPRFYYILINLQDKIYKMWEDTPRMGMLTKGCDVQFSKSLHKKPDLCYLTNEQVYGRYEYVTPNFVIEFVTEDNADFVNPQVYLENGVELVWHLFPLEKEIHVFKKEGSFEVISGEKSCSAEPLIEGYTFKLSEIFKKLTA